MLEDLAATRRVLTFDNALIGESKAAAGQAPPELSVQSMAASTVALIQGLGLDRPDVMG